MEHAAGNYVRLHAAGQEYFHRETMSRLESGLDPAKFTPIHRPTIVNVARVKQLCPLFRGDFAVILRDRKRLTLGKAYRDRLSLLIPQLRTIAIASHNCTYSAETRCGKVALMADIRP
jgi:DNA-binding LytR/AlgR family response regulator